MKRLGWTLTAAILAAAPILAASTEPELSGPIKPELVLETSMSMPLFLKTLTPEQAASLPAPLAPGDKGFNGTTPSILPETMRVVLVEPKDGGPFLYLDRNRDGLLAADERVSLPVSTESKRGERSATLSMPVEGPFKSYPFEISWVPENELRMPPPMRAKGDAVLFLAGLTYIEGRVPVDGKEVLVRCAAGGDLEGFDPHQSTIQMDVDGDGKIESGPYSQEIVNPEGGDAIFRVGNRYLSLSSIDLAAGKMALKSHPASEYKRLDLTPGTALPDFSFVDLEGKSHKISDWRGRYVLLDFWATWCAPCIAEFPNVKKAYEQFHPRGFDVIGVIYNDTNEKVSTHLKDSANQLPWIQATAESTKELATQRLRLRGVPFTLLLDPQGKIVSSGREDEPSLRGEELAATLAELLPATKGKVAGQP